MAALISRRAPASDRSRTYVVTFEASASVWRHVVYSWRLAERRRKRRGSLFLRIFMTAHNANAIPKDAQIVTARRIGQRGLSLTHSHHVRAAFGLLMFHDVYCLGARDRKNGSLFFGQTRKLLSTGGRRLVPNAAGTLTTSFSLQPRSR